MSCTHFAFVEMLNGRIVPLQNSSSQHIAPHFVSTGEETQLVVDFHDPEHFLNQAQDITFYWSVNEVNYGSTKVPVFKYTFTEVKKYFVDVVVSAKFAEPTTTSKCVLSTVCVFLNIL